MNHLMSKRFTSLLALFVFVTFVGTGLGAARAYGSENDATPSAPNVSAPVDTVDVYRLYNPYSGEHIYTKDRDEIKALLALGWQDEDIEWMAPVTSNMPMWRLYNPYSHEHLFTMDTNEYHTLDSIGWDGEGILCYSAPATGDPIYRLYNPFDGSENAHHYTTDANERDALLAQGWIPDKGMNNDGASCYGATEDPVDDHEVTLQADVKRVDAESWEVDDPADGVKALDAAGSAQEPNVTNTMTVSDAEGATLKVGDVVADYSAEEKEYGDSMVVEKIEKTADGYLVTGRQPELGELIDYLDVSGTVDATDQNGEVTYAEGVTPLPNDTGDPSVMKLSISPQSLGINARAIDGGYEFPLDEGIVLTVKPDVKYDLKYGFFSIRKAMLVATLDTELNIDNYSFGTKYEKELYTYDYTVPYTLGTVVLSTTFNFVAEGNGTVNLTATSHVSEGFNYEGGRFRWMSDTPQPELTANFKGAAKAGVWPDASVKVLGLNTIYMGVEGGLGANAELSVDQTGVTNCDVKAYPYMTFFLNRKWNAVGSLLNSIGVPTTFTLLDASNPSTVWSYHMSVA